MHRNKRVGDETERVARETLRQLGFPWTQRTRAGYERDAGDLHLVPGPAAIAQCKFWKTYAWTEWLDGLALQIEEAGADHGFLIVRRPGMPAKDARTWLAVQTVEQHARLLRQAGYGHPLDPGGSESPQEPPGPPVRLPTLRDRQIVALRPNEAAE